MKYTYSFLKRLFDIVASLGGIIVTLPIWFVVIIGIEISDPGPLFYFARRVGKNNKYFYMIKFRSMRVDKNANEKSLRPEQSRIYPFGRFIRAAKLDELPQLLNVFLGSMTVVGPRPASVEQLSVTRGGENSSVASVKAGLTSPAALYDYLYGDFIEDEKEYEDKVLPARLALDRYYIGKQSMRYDMKLIWYTVRSIWGTIAKKIPVDILEEMLDAVDGDRQAIEEVKRRIDRIGDRS